MIDKNFFADPGKPDPNEQLTVTMTRARWSAMLDHLNAELQPKLETETATQEEIDIVVHLACAIISAGASRMEHAIVTHKLGLMTVEDIELIERLREDSSELLAEHGWWADEPHHSYHDRYHEHKGRIADADVLLDKLKGAQTP